MIEQSTKSISLLIDGQSVNGQSGQTVMQVARDNGINIPSLCDSPKLDAFGSCRMCIVEVDGVRGVPSSCTTPARDGMEVQTQSERLSELRKGITELYYSEHPIDCLTDTRNCGCELHDVASDVELRTIRYDNTPHHFETPIDTSSPFFSFDASKCIVCSRCIRACDDIQVTHALSLDGRGFL
ncbi:MAG: 2Fe-2S iron-sulfur cluster-binding protein, partial [Candidatus Thalassarchaeaceae archaeon]|nr:2Fe-2S iron-sulfur cluster-binding protein [Candidatus Thalassarchaeaceae archaeon]